MKKKRRPGRPRKHESPNVDWTEIDRLLVQGDKVATAGKDPATVSYPSYRELAERFGVSHSMIAKYAKDHDCLRRREDLNYATYKKATERLMELRADEIAVNLHDNLRTVGRYLIAFESKLQAGEVPVNNPSDYNTMVRLQRFLEGGADSRRETISGITLEDLEKRHAEFLKRRATFTPAMYGIVTDQESTNEPH